MASVFGSCGDKFVTWETGLFDELGRDIIRFTSADGEETLDLCLDPAKGAMIGEEVLPVIDGMIQLPSDMFGSGELSEDGGIYTITFPGQEPQDLCVNPVKTVNGVAPDETGDVITPDEKGVETINGEAPDENGDLVLPQSSTMNEGDFRIITTDDGRTTQICLRQYKGLQDNGDGTLTEVYISNSGIESEGETIGTSSTTPSADMSTHTIITSEGTPTTVCVNQYKGLRENADGTQTEIFVDQDGNEVEGATIAAPSQSGEPQLSTVDADGNTTYVDADGATQTVPATDVNGDPVDPGQAVWNFIDGEGNYLGSKPCADETVLVETEAGVELPFNPATNNQVLPAADEAPVTDIVDGNGDSLLVDGVYTPAEPVVLRDCAGEEIDTTDEDQHIHTAAQGSLFTALGRGANGTNANVFNQDCLPPDPPCPDHPTVTSRDGILWQWDVAQQRWRAIAATSCPRFHETDNRNSLNLTNDDLVAAFAANGTGVALELATADICITNDDCMQRVVSNGQYRANPTSELSSQININVLTEFSTDGGATWQPSTTWGGTPGRTMGLRACLIAAGAAINPACNFVIDNDDFSLDQHSPASFRLNPGETLCIRTQVTYTFAEDYVSRADNRLTPGAQQLTFRSERNTEVICTAQVFDGYQF